MKRKFLALLCIVALLVLSLASCSIFDQGNSGNNDDTCEHTYSDKWSTSTTHHWHAATCEHAELKTDTAAHTDADENGKCDVCDYELGHVHTFEDKWTSNDTHHWKVATCSHTDEKGELDVHTDSNRNAECDVCSAHVHVLNLNGDCAACEEHVTDVDVTDINVVLPFVFANAVNVVGGNIVHANIVTDLEMEDDELAEYYVGFYKEVTFVLGNGAAYYKVDTTSFYGDSQYTDSQESWYELVAEELVFGVYQYTYDGETSDFEIDASANTDSLTGYYFPVSTLTDAYGAENLLATLYALSQSAAASDYEYLYEDGVYTFTFSYLDVNSDTGEGEGDHADYYEIGVAFALSENGTLTDLEVICNCYTNSLEDELDNDYIYDQNTGTIEMKETAVPDVYAFMILQEEGERTYVSEHPKSNFIPESFDAFVDADLTTQLGETVTVTEGETFNIYFGNFLPETTDAKYLMDTFVATHDELNVFSWAYNGVVSFSANVGSYDIVFTLGGETFAFTLVVEEYVPEVEEQPENSVAVNITNADTYAWSAIASFTAPADGDYTFYVPVGYGAWDKVDCDNNFSGAPYVDLYNTTGGIFTVSVKEGETYEFYVSYVETGVIYITYTVDDYTGSDDNGEGDDGVATEVVAGSYLGSNPYRGESTLVIDTAAGTVSMDGQVFAYTFENGVMTLYLNGNAMPDFMLGVTLGADGVPTAFVNNGNTYTVISGAGDEGGDEGDETVETVVEGTYTGTDMYGNALLTVTVEGNNVTFTYNHPMMGPSSLNTTYAFVDGALVLYNEDGSELHPLAGSLTVDATGTPVSASYNGNDYTLTVGGSSDDGSEEKNPAEAVLGYYSMEGYDVIISEDYEVEGAYVFNAWNDTADIYYDLTVVDNGDGSYTLVLSLYNPENDVFGFLSEEFTVYVYSEYDKVMYGPALEVEIPDYEDITVGTHTVTLTTEMIDSGYVSYDLVVESEGFYSVTGITAIFCDVDGNYYGLDSALLSAGSYVLKLSVWEAVEGDLEFTLSVSAMGDLTAEQFIAAACGEYWLGELTYSIYTSGDGTYNVNVYESSTWDPDVYYVVTELVKNDDDSISFVLALDSESSDVDAFNFAGTTVTIAYDSFFVLTHA